MLDQDTKRKIDNARDILVGKVPDPKSQVEQITIALIYKFMDDMDKESVALGGKAAFFKGEYEKYTWSRIFDPKLGGFDLIKLYSEAITTMNHNENIPQLFRDIFKNAFLPYRDPETLKSFLKEINEFKYDHSEKLGDAFEYLLSVLGSQGDAGQFRTPRHIIDFIVSVVDPKKNESILDPACGTAGFLISSFKHILSQNTKERKGDCLTMDERKKLMNNLVGYDISPDMVRLSLVNMYLHGFSTPKIHEYDTLTSEEKWNETYDVILANPPFMTPKGGIRPHKRFSVQANRSEVLFVDYMMEHISTNGRVGVIVPEGIIFQSANAYKALRKLLVDTHLFAVVSLPSGVFQPYAGVKTSILLMDRTLAKRAPDILFVKIESDGFDLGAQRRPNGKSDLPAALEVVLRYKKSLQEGKECEFSDEEKRLAQRVEKGKIAEGGDYNLSGERYKDVVARANGGWDMVEIGSVCNLINGRAFKPSDWEKKEQGGLPIIRIQNLNNPNSEYNYFSGSIDEKIVINKGDLLFSWSGSRGTSFGPHIWNNEKAILNQHIFKVEHPNTINRYFLYLILKESVTEVEENLHGGVGLVHITKGNLERIKIPLPPLSVQQEIVAEIEGYQKIIDGARQVVENYKPRIKVDESCDMVELEKVCEIISDGTHETPTYENNGIIFLSSKNVTKRKIDWDDVKYISQQLHEKLSKRVSPKMGDILLAKNGTTGVAAIVDRELVFDIYVSLALLRPSSKVDSLYLLDIINTDLVKKQFNSRLKGIGVPNLHLKEIKEVKIPLPPLDVQKEIVARIEEEQKLVDANKKLIELFEGKMKAKIAEVWG